jgi:Asp-tRNA(Asn)/Glu-tRNA(Gln) amidotransferase C subunit
MMVFGRQQLLREVASLLKCAQLAEDAQKAADLIKQAADILALVAELSVLDDPDITVH